MSLIVPWGNAFENMPNEAKELYRQYKQYCDECSKAHDFTCSGADAKVCEAKKKELLDRVLDLADKRKFCVVINNGFPKCVRHIIRVSDDAEQHLEELKAEYYADYSKLPDDKFVFCTGLHNAEKMYKKVMK